MLNVSFDRKAFYSLFSAPYFEYPSPVNGVVQENSFFFIGCHLFCSKTLLMMVKNPSVFLCSNISTISQSNLI